MLTYAHEASPLAVRRNGTILRPFLEAQLKILAAGGDPACVAFNETDAYVRLEAGQELLEGNPA